MATKVTGEQYYELDGKLLEIMRQVRQKNGYPYDIAMLNRHLHAATEGRFLNIPGRFLAEISCSPKLNGNEICDLIKRLNPLEHLSDATESLLQMDVLPMTKDVCLWSVNGQELGFTTSVMMYQIYERAEQFGLGMITSQMIVNYFIKIKHDNVIIKNHVGAMEPAIVKANHYDPFCIFDIINMENVMGLSYREAHKNSKFSPETRWIFTCPSGWIR